MGLRVLPCRVSSFSGESFHKVILMQTREQLNKDIEATMHEIGRIKEQIRLATDPMEKRLLTRQKRELQYLQLWRHDLLDRSKSRQEILEDMACTKIRITEVLAEIDETKSPAKKYSLYIRLRDFRYRQLANLDALGWDIDNLKE